MAYKVAGKGSMESASRKAERIVGQIKRSESEPEVEMEAKLFDKTEAGELKRVNMNKANPLPVHTVLYNDAQNAIRGKAGVSLTILDDEQDIMEPGHPLYSTRIKEAAFASIAVRRKLTKDEFLRIQDEDDSWTGPATGPWTLKFVVGLEILECSHYLCKDVNGDANEIYPGEVVNMTRNWDDGKADGAYKEFTLLCPRVHTYPRRSPDVNGGASNDDDRMPARER